MDGLGFNNLYMMNFCAFVGEHTIDLAVTPGIYLIRGENLVAPRLESNGAGKTTIMNAICWVLEGKTLIDERPGSSVEPWTGERPTVVAINISRDNHFYRIKRGRNPNLLTMGVDGQAEEPCEQKRIDEVLGLSYEALRYTIMLSQFGLFFLDLTPEDQTALVSEALYLDLWLRAADIAGDGAKSAATDLDGAKSRASRLEGAKETLELEIQSELEATKAYDLRNAQERAALAERLRQTELQLIELAKVGAPKADTATVALEESFSAWSDDASAIARTLYADESQLNSFMREQRDLSAKLAAYKGTKCPECGQDVPQAHIAAKRKPLVDRLAVVNAEIPKMERVIAAHKKRDVGARQRVEGLKAEIMASKAAYTKANAKAIESATRRASVSATAAAITADIKRLRTAPNPHTARVEDLARRLAQANADLNTVVADRERLDWEISAYDYWRDEFRRIRLDMIDTCLSGLQETTNATLETLGLEGWRIEIVTERETVSGKLARKMAVMLYPPGAVEPVRFKSYCGGEVQRMQLAFRFALAEILLSAAGVFPSLEILDEPSAHLTENGVEDLLDYIRERAIRLGRVIFVVEHRAIGYDKWDGVLSVVHDAGGSVVSWGEPERWDPRAESGIAQEAAL